MAKVIGVRFRNTGKTYFFDPRDVAVEKDDHVIVETAKGIEYGLVVNGIQDVDDSKVVQPLRPVLRKATERDDEQVEGNHRKEKDAFRICQDKIREHGLEMKLTEAEYAFDNSKILFYFTADGRIDFRDLVKDLAAVFHTRIELRQIGVRDEARAIGGYGSCGRPLCCTTYLNDFVPVSIKMAKEQNLSLNPTKISGVCGRLMCCLNNEEETYEELNKIMPALGDIVEGDDGLQGEVQSMNILRQTVRVMVEVGNDREMHEYKAENLTMIRRKKGRKAQQDAEAAAALAALEGENSKGGNRKQGGEKNENKPQNQGDGAQKKDRRNRKDGKQGGENRENRGERNGAEGSGNREERRERNQNQGERNQNQGDRNQGDRNQNSGDKGQNPNREGKNRNRHRGGRNHNRGNHENRGEQSNNAGGKQNGNSHAEGQGTN
jgi:cell fate regulator YaaT (PSP1 superfamily)